MFISSKIMSKIHEDLANVFTFHFSNMFLKPKTFLSNVVIQLVENWNSMG